LIKPDVCPVCDHSVELPSDRRLASTVCSSCSGHLWVITHDGKSYLLDANDKELYQHYTGKFRAQRLARYAANGWTRQAKPIGERTIFEMLVEHRKFSLQKRPIVELPGSGIVLDFSKVRCSFPIATEEQITIESVIRRLLIEAFVECSGSDLCFAIDVNHSQYTFVPSEVDPDDHNGWPISLTPFSEYLAFNNRDFSQGIFVDPTIQHMSVYGVAFESRFRTAFEDRLIPV